VIHVLLQKNGFQQEDLDMALLVGAAPKVQLYDRGIAEGYLSTEFTNKENMIKLSIDAGANPNTANGDMGFHPSLGDNSGDLPITVLARDGPLSRFQSCLE
jgi:hypothetical protein